MYSIQNYEHIQHSINQSIIGSLKQIRIKDIAEKAKVSIGTVDRVLHNRGEVADSTKKKILKRFKKEMEQAGVSTPYVG